MSKKNRTLSLHDRAAAMVASGNPADNVAAIAAAATDPKPLPVPAEPAPPRAMRLADMLQAQLAETPKEIPGLEQGLIIGNNVAVQRIGDVLMFAVGIGDGFMARAKPSKGKVEGEQGALCLIAGSGGWKPLGLKGLKFNFNVGYPNPNAPKRTASR